MLSVLFQGSAREKLSVLLMLVLALFVARRDRTPRPSSAPPGPAERQAGAVSPRQEELEARLARLEQQQLEVAANLRDANTAFRQWNAELRGLRQRVDGLAAQLERAGVGGVAEPAAAPSAPPASSAALAPPERPEEPTGLRPAEQPARHSTATEHPPEHSRANGQP